MFLTFAVGWIWLNGHSGYVRYHESAGNRAFERVSIPDELALAQADPRRWISAREQEQIEEGRGHYAKAFGVGIFTNGSALPKAAWLEYLGGDIESAVGLLARGSEIQNGRARALSLYYRGAILNRIGRAEEALLNLDAAILEAPDLAIAAEERGESLWRLGRHEEAVAAWKTAVDAGAKLPLTLHFLAGATDYLGDPEKALDLQAEADRITPHDARFHWMVGTRLQNIGMNDLAAKQFELAMTMHSAGSVKKNAGTETAPAYGPLK
jgi:tetratricopeptide (TPR) repeat protein